MRYNGGLTRSLFFWVIIFICPIWGSHLLNTLAEAQEVTQKPNSTSVQPDQQTKTQDKESHEKKFYNPQDVTSMVWTMGKRSITLKKDAHGNWHSSGGKTSSLIDPWTVQRRLMTLSHFTPSPTVKITTPLGHVKIKTAKQTFEGEYDAIHFQWNQKGQNPEGFSFEENGELRYLFGEGVQGFDSHTLTFCDPAKVESVMVAALWTLTQHEGQWTLKTFDDKENPARLSVVQSVVKKFCKVKVDYFVADSHTDNEIIVITERKKNNPVIISNSSGFYFAPKIGAFISSDLDGLTRFSASELIDPSAEQGRMAVNPQLTARERTDAIHKIKAEASPAGIPALKALVNEDTSVDAFRYEAVDALQAIGTKEAFKIIADRLQTVTPSGFQLKLARTLGTSMGHTIFASDKTSEGERQVEIRKLLEDYKKKPVGR